MSGDLVEKAVDEWLGSGNDAERDSDLSEYRRFAILKYVFIGVCVFIAFIVAGFAISIGEYTISFTDTYVRIWEHITGNVTDTLRTESFGGCVCLASSEGFWRVPHWPYVALRCRAC